MWHNSVFEEMVYKIVFYNGRRFDVVRFKDTGQMITLMWRYSPSKSTPKNVPWFGPFPDVEICRGYQK